ncbi:C25 family cysteine peptidase [Candidatus Albibeggiatoa sp. nov. NOAA]|uniref:C25 family cysteine peptidase n=1 Tax=Candidatus Albibeggiatoa sp. nov. NOAA TaxID=3162724 RepID=UPI0032FFF4FC|nr:C25 family cysteine peptidase [Thiotrichaceae bacterium]
MKRFILLLLFSLLYYSSAWAQDLKIVDRGSDWVELELQFPTMSNPLQTVVGDDQQTYQRIVIEQWAKTKQAGYPELPMLATLVQVPANGKVTIEDVQFSENTLTTDADIYPVAKPVALDSGEITAQFTRDEQAYQSNQLYPHTWLELGSRANLRGEPVMQVKVYPVRWNAADHTLSYLSSLRFRLAFSESLPPMADGRQTRSDNSTAFDDLLHNTINGYVPRQRVQRADEDILSSPFAPKRYTVSFEVASKAVYRIKYSELLEAGMPEACLSQGQFILYFKDQQIMPLIIAKNPRQFGEGDVIEFYANNYKDHFTDTSIFRLDCWQLEQARSDIQTTAYDEPVKLGNFLDGTVTGTGIVQPYFMESLHYEKDGTYWTETPNAPEQDYWFWFNMFAPTSKKAYVNVYSAYVTDEPLATLRLALQGASTVPPDPNHHLIFSVNGTEVGDTYWNGDDYHIAEIPFSTTALIEKTNEILLNAPNDTGAEQDVTYLDWVEIDFPRQFQARNSTLKFNLQGTGERYQVTVKGFNLKTISVYDITDPYHIKEILNPTIEQQTDTDDYQVTFDAVVDGERTYYALINTRIKSVADMQLVPEPRLRNGQQGADYIMITIPEYVEAAQPLLTHRQNQGYRTSIVTVDEIYREFGEGLANPQAIKDFLVYAYNHWAKPTPRYIVLLGTATFLYKDEYEEDGNKHTLVPTHFTDTRYGVTPDDNWFVSVDGDDELADMAIGRLPAKTVAEVNTVVEKLITYENDTSDAPRRVLFVADRGAEFESANDQLELFLEKRRSFAYKVYLDDYGKDTASATQQIIDYVNEGVSIMQYIGHGHIELWGKSELFRNDHLPLLGNEGKYTFMMALNCLNAYFSDMRKNSLGENFVITDKKGGIATFSSAGLGYLWEYQLLNDQWYRSVFIDGQTTLGDVITASKIATFSYGASRDILSNLVLIGDPATKLRVPTP